MNIRLIKEKLNEDEIKCILERKVCKGSFKKK